MIIKKWMTGLMALGMIPLIWGCAGPASTIVTAESGTAPAELSGGDGQTETPVVGLKEYIEKAEWDKETVLTFPEAESFLLENGLKVMVFERHDLPMVYARAQIRGGSIYDPPDKSGLAYLTGWVLTEGTESYTNTEMDAVMDRHGAYVTSVAYNESCIATLNCLSGDTDTLFPYFAEILSRAAFYEENLRDAQNYLVGDLMRIRDDYNELCYRQFRSDVFDGHPYSKAQKGTIQGIQACSRQDVLDFYHRYYAPNHAVLVLVGDVTLDQVKTLCKKYLADWKPVEIPLPDVPAPDPVTGRRITLIDRDTAQAHITLGHIGINRTAPERFELEVMNRILGGGGLFTRLATEVRVKRGLTYGIYSFFAEREYTGEFAVGTFTKTSTVGETVRVILNELEKIRSEPVTDKELKDAKQGLIGGFPLQFEQYEGIAQTYVHMNFYNLPATDITNYPSHIYGVTREDVLEAAKKYIHPGDLVITIVGPAEIIEPQLTGLGEITVLNGN